MLGMVPAHQWIIALSAMALIYVAAFMLVWRTLSQHYLPIIQSLIEGFWPARAGVVVGYILAYLLGIAGGSVMNAAARGKNRTFIARRAAWLTVLLMAWQADIFLLVARQSIQVPDLLLSAATAICATIGLMALGQRISRSGRPYKQWLELEVAE